MTIDAPARVGNMDARSRRRHLAARFWPVIWVASSLVTALHQAQRGPIGVLLAVAFLASTGLLGAASARGPLRIGDGLRSDDRCNLALVTVGALFAGPCIALMHLDATSLVFYVVVALALVVDLRWALAATVLACLALVAVDGNPAWGQTRWMALGLLASGIGAGLGRRSAQRGREARLATERAHQLEISEERNRMARDLHDILGHSLTVITLKTELATKLVDADPAAAKQQLAEVQSISRAALADVRSTVNNYREISLAGEIARAANTLASAGVRAELPAVVDDVDPQLRELFAWALREGVTNVVRHAHASRCVVSLAAHELRVADDGVGLRGPGDGHGLEGLRARCEAAGATLVLGAGLHGKGTELRVASTSSATVGREAP